MYFLCWTFETASTTLTLMNVPTTKALLVCCLFLISLGAVASDSAQDKAPDFLRKELAWSQRQTEIADIRFSEDGRLVTFVSRVHWPDGEEAEGLPESFFRKLELRKQEDPRFADPVVKVVDLKGNLVCEARYGTHPAISPDDKSVVFSRQKQPISGLRALAATLAGNDLQAFDCATKQMRAIAQSNGGYLDDPLFLPGGNSVAYTENEAVNGAMGGPVAVVKTDLESGREEVLLAKNSTPSVPCPPAPSAKSDLQAFMCAHQPTNPSASFPNLILRVGRTDSHLLVLIGKPLPSAGDMYLAENYAFSLVSVFPGMQHLLSIEQTEMSKLWQLSLQAVSGERALLFLGYWKEFSVASRRWLPDAGPRNTNPRSVYSPDMKYYLAAEPSDEPNHFALRRVADGKSLVDFPKMANVYEATWSHDSKRLAMVGVPLGASGSAYREELIVFSLP